MNTRHIILGSMMLAAIPLYAQNNGTLRGTVNVEGRFLPDIVRQERITMLPEKYKFSIDAEKLNFDNEGICIDYAPDFLTLPAIGWRDTRTIDNSRGYIDLSSGSWLNTNLSAGYRFVDDRTTTLGVMLQHNSTSLWKPQVSLFDPDSKRKLYDQTLGLFGIHDFNGLGTLSASLDYRLAYFNYFGYHGAEAAPPTQTINDIRAHAGWKSTTGSDLSWDADISARYFGFRSLYTPQVDVLTANTFLSRFSGERETDIALAGNIRYSITEKSQALLGVKADALIYSDPQYALLKADNYGNVRLTPAYRFTRGNMNVNIGAEINLTFNAGPADNRFSAFHIAPDIRFGLRANPLNFFFGLGGGVKLNTLAEKQAEDYYCLPALVTTRPLNTPIEASLGVNTTRFAGFSAGVAIYFRNVKNAPIDGWYTRWLNSAAEPMQGLDSTTEPIYLDREGKDMHGWKFSAFADYDPGNIIKLHMEGAYLQNGSKCYFNGVDRPRWILSLAATANPIEPFDVTLKYEYRGVRNILLGTFTPSAEGVAINGETGTYSYIQQRLSDITNLSLTASYRLTKKLTITAGADNLLNRKIELLPDVPSQGITFNAGFQYLF